MDWATYNKKKADGIDNTEVDLTMKTSPIHVSFFTCQVCHFSEYIVLLRLNALVSYTQIDKTVTEESLRNIFIIYGNITDVTINKFAMDEVSKH